jgi:archaeal flagellar protein FlaJ
MINRPVESYLSRLLVISFGIAIFIALLIRIFLDFSFLITFFGAFVLVQSIAYSYLVLSADAKAKFVEEILPDVLQLMATNLRAGFTVDRAFLLAARPEFGQFKDEINRVGKEIATGRTLEDSMTELGARIRSNKLQKTIQLILSGIASGGEIADLLQHTSSNLRHQHLIDERIRSNVLVYVIFIFSAIGFGAPTLFGLSSFLIEVITNIFSSVQLPTAATASAPLPITFSEISITPRFVNTYTIISMIMTSVMGSLIMGLISKGKEKEGFKYIPILLVLTISLFFLVKFFISNLLSGLFQF